MKPCAAPWLISPRGAASGNEPVANPLPACLDGRAQPPPSPMHSRRSFLKLAPLAVGACALAPRLLASAPATPVEEDDPAAAASGENKDAATEEP